ncbi:hypothetical protein Asulf_00056 [Archaeoglobus sulfaticallidus PM70-1]|uniref:Membrane-bound metal-dependent hydrolase n=1 Tax=Archaeoglobus sulfaticallidus PM70-1 TaxID=387631 RepID=N0BCY7_9EURY|nr:metal-dependent hydrolase [Archaeoglobus sulfaticallidus]AGK60092.1 hypothetical protein Asulf_00056 [Archaeoglobus sulfaticallidus PM70-1]
MPDWLAHVLFAYILCKVLGIRFKVFSNENTAIVIVGSLVPDTVKVGLIFDLIDVHAWDFIAPLHTPAGSLLVAGLISLLFYEVYTVFLLLILGFTTHYMLDLLLKHVSGGMLLLFPFSWGGYQLGLIQVDDYRITLVFVVLAVIVYAVTRNKTS